MKRTFGNTLLRIWALPLMLLALATTSCAPDPDKNPTQDPVAIEDLSVYVISQGGSGKANGLLDFYAPASKTLTSNVFTTVNGIPLGDTAQSGRIYGDHLFVAVYGSNVVFKIDAKSQKRLGQLEVKGPREIHFVSPEKAYISHLGSGDITIFNPKTMTITGKITTYQSNLVVQESYKLSTEMWVKVDDKHVAVSCWSYHNKVLVIDTTQDKVVKEIEVGTQPNTLDIDKNGKLWVLCEGRSWDGINPSIWTIDTKNNYKATQFGKDIQKYETKYWGPTTALNMNLTGDAFYFINSPHVFKMSITDKEIPTTPFIEFTFENNPSSLSVAPNGDLYIGDAKDNKVNGEVFRYSADGKKLHSFLSGVVPGDFAFYIKKK